MCATARSGAPRAEPSKRARAAPRSAARAGAAAALQHEDGLDDAPHDRPRPEEGQEEEIEKGDVGCRARVPEESAQAAQQRTAAHHLGAIQEHREVPKARKVRRSMRRHSLGAMPLSPDEKTPPRKRSPVKKKAPPKWEQFAREKGISPRPKTSPPTAGHAGRGAEIKEARV